MIKISKKLQWLDEYLSMAKAILPKVRRLKSIKIITPKEGQLCRIYGALTHRPDNFYSMTLYSKYNSIVKLRPKPVLIQRVFSKVDILGVFAHELAHLTHWEHTPQHKMLEAKLTMIFMARLAESGYISEEHENKTRRKADALQFHRCE